jgi:hypothetical protein
MNTKLVLSAFAAALVLAACSKQEAAAPEAAPAEAPATEAPADPAAADPAATDPAATDATMPPADGSATTETPPADAAEPAPQQ